ncbi:hypothetical protein DFP72DRAFT_552270 [Ephemerocybe angulata]|uniref:Uncharacterized protein n=1 Tax=Ephemerocybe angulata TaxID=980116 RepID=A0A8H6HNK0_9AGAR|nr:hypothetical protein DFP72DRAFT_552270 [Tulosesus angulatus]
MILNTGDEELGAAAAFPFPVFLPPADTTVSFSLSLPPAAFELAVFAAAFFRVADVDAAVGPALSGRAVLSLAFVLRLPLALILILAAGSSGGAGRAALAFEAAAEIDWSFRGLPRLRFQAGSQVEEEGVGMEARVAIGGRRLEPPSSWSSSGFLRTSSTSDSPSLPGPALALTLSCSTASSSSSSSTATAFPFPFPFLGGAFVFPTFAVVLQQQQPPPSLSRSSSATNNTSLLLSSRTPSTRRPPPPPPPSPSR